MAIYLDLLTMGWDVSITIKWPFIIYSLHIGLKWSRIQWLWRGPKTHCLLAMAPPHPPPSPNLPAPPPLPPSLTQTPSLSLINCPPLKVCWTPPMHPASYSDSCVVYWVIICTKSTSYQPHTHIYSGTSEIRTPRDLAKMSLFRRCP